MSIGQRPEALLLTVSFNVADYQLSPYFLSREEWCGRTGVRHVYVSEETTGHHLDAHCAAWLRIPLMLLLKGRDIFYVDNDCVIREDCPTPSTVAGGQQGLHMALGHSGRPNSGVMFATGDASDILGFCIERYAEMPPEACRAPYENGHVIWGCRHYLWRELPQRFNVTRGDDGYIVHHTGPNLNLRTISYHSPPGSRFDFSVGNVLNADALLEMGRRIYRSSCFDDMR